MRKLKLYLAFWIVCLALAQALRAGPVPISLDLDQLKKTIPTVTSDRYPDADDVLVDDYLHTKYQADGTSITYDDQAFKILTEKGRKANRTITLWFNQSYGSAKVVLAEIYKGDGKVVKVDVEKLSQVMVDRSQMSSNIFDPNHKNWTTTIPDLEVGDTLRFVTRHETTKPRVPNTFSDYHTFEGTQPIVRYKIEIDAPKALPLKHHILKDQVEGTVAFSQKEAGDRIVYQWVAQNVPQMFPEPDMPARYTVVQRLLVSTIASWNDVSKWYWNLCLPRLKTTDAMKAKVNELTKGLTNREEIIRAVFRFVSQEIRYMGITVEKEAPGYEPHDVELTFNNRHGVCRDKAALLVAMLKLANIEAFPVLIHAGPLKDSEIPQPYFNHAVTAALNSDGTYMLMDSTDENTKQLFPSYLANKSFLVARPDGETLKTTPFSPAKDNMLTIEAKAEIHADGSLDVTADIAFDGINDNSYRGAFANRTPQQQRQFFERIAKHVAPGAIVKSLVLTPKDMLDTETMLKATIQLHADTNLFVASGENAILTIPQFGSSLGIINFVLGNAGLEKRKYPFCNDIACGVRESIEFKIDPAWGKPVVLPSYQDISDGQVKWTKSLDFNPSSRTLELKSEFAINTVQFMPDQYLALKSHLKTIEVNNRKKAIFSREATFDPETADQAEIDIEFIYDDLRIELSDEFNWTETKTVKMRILTYNGKKMYSEIKESYNPIWEDVKLDYARVTNPDKATGKSIVKEISKEEINLMDAGWVASAPRYPAGKTLVASLPGVEIGSEIEYKLTRVVKNYHFFSCDRNFRGVYPIAKRTLTISSPLHIKLQTAVFQNGYLASDLTAHENNIIESVKPDNGRNVWTWTSVNQPMIAKERSCPPSVAFLPSVQTTTGNWATHAAKIALALKSKAVPGSETKKLIETFKALPRSEQVKAVRDTVAKSIRTAGPNFLNLPLDCLTEPDVTLKEGYGHAGDAAILLYAILSELGLQPEFILATTSPRYKKILQNAINTPSYTLYDAVLVRVVDDGKTIWLNDQNHYAQLGTTRFEDCPALLMNGKSDTIKPDQDRKDETHTLVTLEIKDDATAILTERELVSGSSFAGFKQLYDEITPEERRRHIQEIIAGISQNATLIGEFTTKFDQYPGERSFACQIKDYGVIDKDFMYFNILTGRFTRALSSLTDKRKNPLYWSWPVRNRYEARLVLPPSYKNVLILPEVLEWTQPSGDGTLSAKVTKQDNGDILFTYEVNLKPDVIQPEQYQELIEIAKRLTHSSMRTILLKK